LEPDNSHRTARDLIENLLFLSTEPLSLHRLCDALPYSREEITSALDTIQHEYLEKGLKIRFISGGWQLTTDPALATEVEEFFNIQRRRRLSRQALETLAVIAYNQPMTRTEIEAIRGVGTSGTLQTLVACNMIRVVGQKDALGNPYLYGTTEEFLQHFGLGSVNELPSLEFEKEGLTPPPIKLAADTGEIKPVDFDISDEQTEETKEILEKGA
jgi:segregation and condensation protein B